MVIIYSQGDSVLADSGTEQLEFIALSQRTGDPKYQQKVLSEKVSSYPCSSLVLSTTELGRKRMQDLMGMLNI